MNNDSNPEIITASEYAVKAAQKELNKTLDYSIDTFQNLEALIQYLRTRFSSLRDNGKLSEKTVQQASISLGAYLGEVIRRHHGGAWVARNPVMKTLVINGKEFSPILYIFQRLAKDSNLSLENYWSDIHQKLYPVEKIEEKPPVIESSKKTTSTLTGDKRLILGGVVGIAVLCFIGILAVTIYSNIQRTNEFKAKINTFLVQADKLDVMTGQGVTYQEFRTQLIEVKSTYASIVYWPPKYRDEKLAFDKAIEGWNLTLDIWEFGIKDSNINLDWAVGNYYEDALINYWSLYVGIESSTGKVLSTNDWIGGLMGKASTYFEAGKAGVRQ